MDLNKELLMLAVELLTTHGMEAKEELNLIKSVMMINSSLYELEGNEVDKLEILMLNWEEC